MRSDWLKPSTLWRCVPCTAMVCPVLVSICSHVCALVILCASQEMLMNGVVPDTKLYNSLLRAHGQAPNLSKVCVARNDVPVYASRARALTLLALLCCCGLERLPACKLWTRWNVST